MTISMQFNSVCWRNKLFSDKFIFQEAFTDYGLAKLWNELVKNGEVVGSISNGLLNLNGNMSEKGNIEYFFI